MECADCGSSFTDKKYFPYCSFGCACEGDERATTGYDRNLDITSEEC